MEERGRDDGMADDATLPMTYASPCGPIYPHSRPGTLKFGAGIRLTATLDPSPKQRRHSTGPALRQYLGSYTCWEVLEQDLGHPSKLKRKFHPSLPTRREKPPFTWWAPSLAHNILLCSILSIDAQLTDDQHLKIAHDPFPLHTSSPAARSIIEACDSSSVTSPALHQVRDPSGLDRIETRISHRQTVRSGSRLRVIERGSSRHSDPHIKLSGIVRQLPSSKRPSVIPRETHTRPTSLRSTPTRIPCCRSTPNHPPYLIHPTTTPLPRLDLSTHPS